MILIQCQIICHFSMKDKDYIYVCGACGRTADEPENFSDVSCAVNAVKCHKDKREHPDTGQMMYWAYGVEQ